LPAVRLEVRAGPVRPALHEVSETGLLIGSVAGCDVRLPGADLPPVICLIARGAGGAILRKLVPTFSILLNGQAVSTSPLGEGDQISLAAVELVVRVQHPVDSPQAGPASKELPRLPEGQTTPRAPEQSAATAPSRQEKALQQQQEEMARREKELEGVRQELAVIRQQLYERYRHRRDRLAGLHEAIRRAARKVQERNRLLDTEQEQFRAQKLELDARTQEHDRFAKQCTQEREALAVQKQELQRQTSELGLDLQAREETLVRDRDKLAKDQAQHEDDLVRLDRLEAALETRQQQLDERAQAIDQRFEEMQHTSQELEDQAGELDLWREKLQQQAAQLARTKTEQEAATAQVAQRGAALEGQQAMLAALRTRLERLREELRREQQRLAEQRERLDVSEADLQQRAQEMQEARAQLDADKVLNDQHRRRFEERQAALEDAVEQLRSTQEAVSAREGGLSERVSMLDACATKQADEAARLKSQAAELVEMQKRLQADREALLERENSLVKAEQAREALQEQLQRRSEELATRQRAQAEQARKRDEETAALEKREGDLEGERRQLADQAAAQQKQLEEQTADLVRQRDELGQREQVLRRNVERLKEAGRNIGASRKSLEEERTQWQALQAEAARAAAQTQAEFAQARQQAAVLQEQMPELELRAQAALERLGQARTQLREHLDELHAYARQSQDDIDSLRSQVQLEAEQVRQQQVGLHRAREEHRLAVAAFRQQLIEWQGQLTEMRRSLAHGETRLERRQAQVEEQTRQLGASSARLAQQAEELQEQERVVAEQRTEMERHLDDMREWYRRKLRELSEQRRVEDVPAMSETRERIASAPATMEGSGEPAADVETSSDILRLTEEVDSGDRKLGDLLRSLNLVEPDTLRSLLVEARRRRRSLRQILLAGGYLTLYQMALIETENLDGLVLGPLRVIDRLRLTAHEAAYRVFDPRSSREAVLRHLTDGEMAVAGHADEFRQGFTQAVAIRHPHVAVTLEVLDIAGRPAVLQESLTGLHSIDWPGLAAVPGVWYRLLCQAALGLHTVHQAGMAHGRIDAGQFLLTPEGLVKLCGVGEPAWLAPTSILQGGDSAQDLESFGRLASMWANLAARRKGAKPLPEPLQAILNRLAAEGASQRYASLAALLEDLDNAGASLPPNAEAWDRLLRYVRDHAAEDAGLRQSA
jgi:chromosome segregation ATPase